MTTICMFTPFAAPAGMALADALRGTGHAVTLVETGDAASAGATPHWTDTAAVLAASRNADLVVYWAGSQDDAPGNLAWLPRLAGVLCIDGTQDDPALAMAASHAAGIIATSAAPWRDACTGPFQLLAGPAPHQWVAALATLGPQAMLALPLRAALRHCEATLASWHAAPGLLATPALAAPLDVLRSGQRFL